jgi:hypothetical protein
MSKKQTDKGSVGPSSKGPKNAATSTKEDNEEDFKTISKTRFKKDGYYYDQIHDIEQDVDRRIVINQFIKHNGTSRPIFVKHVETYDEEGNKVIITPAPQIATQKLDRIFDNDQTDYIKFPPAPIEYESEFLLYSQTKGFIHKYVEVRQEDEFLLSLWLLKAVLFDTLKDTSFPMIHIIAPYGKGKSRLLSVLTNITPYGFYLVNISSAPLKRVSELYSPILYVDEKGEMDNETSALLNSKFNRNSVYLNADQKIQRGYSALVGYKLYGPIALAGRTPFKDDAIESKSFQINQNFEMSRKDVPRKIKGKALDEFDYEAKEIRGKLLQFRIKWCDKINEIESSDFLSKYENHLEPRLFEIISFFEDLIEIIPEVKQELSKVLEYQIRRNVEVARETPNGIIASTLLSILENAEDNQIEYFIGGKNYSGIYLSSIYDEVGQNYSKQTGKILSALGLKTDRPRIKVEGKDGEKDKNRRVSVVRIPDVSKLNELKARYDPEYVSAVLSSISQGLQTSVDDEDEEDDEMGDRHINESKKEKEGVSPLNDSPDSPLRPSDNSSTSQEPEKSYVQSDEWQYFKVKESFSFGKYIYQKGKISKFPILKAGTYIEKGLLELPCPSGQVWDPNEKGCIISEGGNQK